MSILRFGLLLTFALGAACSMPAAPFEASLASSEGDSRFAALRQATARFHDVEAAVVAGYAAPEPAACVEVPGLGAMGVHSAHLGLASDLVIDPLQPEVLLYLPESGGGFRLVGVEYFEVALVLTPAGPAPWFETSAPPYPFFNPAPSVFGQVFDGPMAGHEPGMPWHYDQHVWVWAPNPHGVFAPFNPSLSCPQG
ncbi:MAG TPA: hypothetical protein VGQ69_00645 [Gemmatimonadales bacterium]|jgi:hypothetical protein|nr:hypothetical protein [Gemmatimonadales bacterium]